MKWMSRHRVATWLGTGQEKRCRDNQFDVVTWGSLGWCRDLVLASRHGAGCLCSALFGHCSGHYLDTVHGHCS